MANCRVIHRFFPPCNYLLKRTWGDKITGATAAAAVGGGRRCLPSRPVVDQRVDISPFEDDVFYSLLPPAATDCLPYCGAAPIRPPQGPLYVGLGISRWATMAECRSMKSVALSICRNSMAFPGGGLSGGFAGRFTAPTTLSWSPWGHGPIPPTQTSWRISPQSMRLGRLHSLRI